MLQIFEYEGNPIQFDEVNGRIMANATTMFKAENARLDHWRSSPGTKKYIQAVTRKLGIDENDMIVSVRGGDGQGTWIDERLILNAARYISPDFEVWCDEKLSELIRTGSVNISPAQFFIPSTFAEALQLAADQAKQIESQQKQIAEAQPKVDFYEAVTGSSDTVDIGTVAKVLNYPGIGRTKLFQFLRDEKVLMQNNRPFQAFVDKGWFRVVESSWTKPDGSSHVSFKTVVFQKGIDGIRKLLNSKYA